MRTWKRKSNEIQQLVEAFYTNDPYYPRPNPDDPLYKSSFSNGYLSAHPKEARDALDAGEAFLRAIENEQRRRNSANRINYDTVARYCIHFVLCSPSLFPYPFVYISFQTPPGRLPSAICHPMPSVSLCYPSK